MHPSDWVQHAGQGGGWKTTKDGKKGPLTEAAQMLSDATTPNYVESAPAPTAQYPYVKGRDAGSRGPTTLQAPPEVTAYDNDPFIQMAARAADARNNSNYIQPMLPGEGNTFAPVQVEAGREDFTTSMRDALLKATGGRAPVSYTANMPTPQQIDALAAERLASPRITGNGIDIEDPRILEARARAEMRMGRNTSPAPVYRSPVGQRIPLPFNAGLDWLRGFALRGQVGTFPPGPVLPEPRPIPEPRPRNVRLRRREEDDNEYRSRYNMKRKYASEDAPE